MRALVILLALALVLTLFAAFPAAAKTTTLEDLEKVVKEYGAEIQKETPDYGPINARASNAVAGLSKMSSREAEAVIKILQFDEAVDPGRTVFDSAFGVLEKNKAALDAASKKLPKKEAEDLQSHIRLSIEANTVGQDQPPHPKK
jgi:hypothetical protein